MTDMGAPGSGEGDFTWPSAPAGSPGWEGRTPPVPSPRPAPNVPNGPVGPNGPNGPIAEAPQSPGPGSGEPRALGANTRCYEHPDRLAGAVCRSCNRPICADCMVQAPVGWHCHQCVRRNARTSPVVRYQPGTVTLPGLLQTPVTLGLIIICVILYIASTADPNLLNETAEWGILVQNGEQYRLFTAIFFHVDFLHITLNMISLLVIGRLVEPALGKARYLALFLVSGLGGSVAAYLFANPQTASVGASGAIFGLFGAYFVIARRAAANTSGILVLIGVNIAYSFIVPGISWQAHIGGLVTGVVVAAGYGLGRGRRQELFMDVATVAVVCAVLGVLLLLPPGVVNAG